MIGNGRFRFIAVAPASEMLAIGRQVGGGFVESCEGQLMAGREALDLGRGTIGLDRALPIIAVV